MADDSVEQWGAEVIVTPHDGRRLARRIDQLVGRGASSMSRAEMWDKFEDCAQRALARERLPALFDLLYRIEDLEDVNVLTRQLAWDVT